jgi:hypothetical protein
MLGWSAPHILLKKGHSLFLVASRAFGAIDCPFEGLDSAVFVVQTS